MKKIISAICILAAAAAFAGAKNTMISFSTPGPDKYADGTIVLDDECYALVWTPSGATFSGFLADGTATGSSKLVFAAPLAKGGKCPSVVFQIDEELVANDYNGGSFGVYLLDTRKTVNDQVVVGQLSAAGKPLNVNTAAKVGEAGVAGGVGAMGTISGGVSAADVIAAKQFKIKAIKVVGANVQITVEGAVNALPYAISTGNDPANLNEQAAEQTKGAGADDEILFVVPKSGDSMFFKVDQK